MGPRRLPVATVSHASPSALSLAPQKTRGIGAGLTISACSSRHAGTTAVTVSAPDANGVALRARMSPQSHMRRVVRIACRALLVLLIPLAGVFTPASARADAPGPSLASLVVVAAASGAQIRHARAQGVHDIIVKRVRGFSGSASIVVRSASARVSPPTRAPSPAASTTARNVCSKPSLTRATCTAQMLVSERTGRPVSFRVHKLRLNRNGTVAHKGGPSALRVHAADSSIVATEPAATLGTPQYLQQAYDLTALSASAGYGDTVGIVDVGVGYQALESDLAQYRAAYDLPPCTTASGCLRITDQNGGSNYPTSADGNSPGWGFETALDVDAVSAICPNCHILLVEANSETVSSYQAAEVTADQLGANQISNSWLEFWSFNRSDFVFPGVATVASAGDYGYLAPPYYNTPYPASFPGVTAAGGTALTPASTPTARGVDETASPYDSSSCSTEPQPPWQANANGGCPTRATADLSADGEAGTGLFVYYSGDSSLTGYTGGGTSLAAALIAAYYGLLGNGVGVGGAAWAYNDSSLLNDITSGNNEGLNGSCSDTLLAALCNAGSGYDGITGVGSISGAVVPGAPGVANGTACDCIGDPGRYVVSSTATTVTLSGGVYPNQLDTHYWWEYGPTSAYGQSTAHTDLGAGASPLAVTDTISGLTPGVRYHFALVAQNSLGTVSYGGADGFTLDISPAPTPTAPALPVADLSAPTFNGPSSVTLQGTINPEGSLTTYYFTEGVADSSGFCTPTSLNYGTDFFPDPVPGSSGDETTPFPVSQTITDLTPGTTYCFGLAAFNAGGSATGAGTTQPSPVAPTVAITNVPPPSSADTSATIAFIVTGNSSATTCTLDGSTAACASGSADLTGLSVGSHTFVVTATGPGGSNFAAVTWEVTPPAPTVAITSAPPANSADTSGSVAFTVSGDSSGTACTLDGVGTPCDSESASFTGLSAGSHTFVVTVTGPGGSNFASATFVVTPPPPTVAITSAPPANSADTSGSVAFTVSGDSNGTVCTLDGVGTPCDSESASFTGLSVGFHTFVVTATGPGGSNFTSATFVVTPPAPTVTLTAVPPATTATASGIVVFTVGGTVTGVACTLDDASEACDSGSASFTDLSVGSHTFVVTATGPSGTASAATTWEVTAAPPGPIPSPIPGPTPSPTPAPTPAPEPFAWSALHLSSRVISNCPARGRSCASPNATFSFKLTERAQLAIILSRRLHGKTRVVARITVWEAAGRDSYVLRAHFGGRVLAPGAYQLNAQAVVGAQHSSAFRATLRVL